MTVRIFIIAGEASGDQLGAGLIRALRRERPDSVFAGVGGPGMQTEGLASLFPFQDLAVMGFIPVLKQLPKLMGRVEGTAQAALSFDPDVLVIIDSPDFTHRVARRVRRANPALPIVDYVSPTVWAWRPGRAAKMRGTIDHVLALLPFEPAAYQRLGGPACTYVGHPLIEKMAQLTPDAADLDRREAAPPMLVILPGSRRSEIERLMPVFGVVLERLAALIGPFDAVLPAVAHLEPEICRRVAAWRVQPRIISDEKDKYAAFRTARAALAASGSVTLELALAHVPMVVAYKLLWIEWQARHFITVPSIVLPNLILNENVVPEFLQGACTPEALAQALARLCASCSDREKQQAAFKRLISKLELPAEETPSARAAAIVLSYAGQRHKRELNG